MDTIAHGLWAYLIGRGTRQRQSWWKLGLISAGPDLVWLPFTFVRLLTNGSIMFFTIPYEISHSLFLWAVVSLLCSLRWKNAWRWSWPWALHILIDIPGHIDMPTPFLWPLIRHGWRGSFDWLTLRLMIINYFCMICIYLFIRWREQKQKFAKNR